MQFHKDSAELLRKRREIGYSVADLMRRSGVAHHWEEQIAILLKSLSDYNRSWEGNDDGREKDWMNDPWPFRWVFRLLDLPRERPAAYVLLASCYSAVGGKDIVSETACKLKMKWAGLRWQTFFGNTPVLDIYLNDVEADLREQKLLLPSDDSPDQGETAPRVGDIAGGNESRESTACIRSELSKPEKLNEPGQLGELSAGGLTAEWDVFISHASEDKEGFVRPLAVALRAKAIRVWFDEFTLTVGDSLRRSIDRGLARSRYGIVVISPDFLKKDWPQKELDGLVARETGARKVILPIWHNVDAETLRQHSPLLADRVATSTAKGVEAVVADLMSAMK